MSTAAHVQAPLSERVRDWLRAHPGWHRVEQLATYFHVTPEDLWASCCLASWARCSGTLQRIPGLGDFHVPVFIAAEVTP